MWVARWLLAFAIGLLASGAARTKSSPRPRPRRRRRPRRPRPRGKFEIAWKVPLDVAKRLHEGDAYELIREEGELIASSDFDDGPSWILKLAIREGDRQNVVIIPLM